MTTEVIYGCVGAFVGLAGLVFGGGIGNRYMKHREEDAVTKYRLGEMKIALDKAIKDISDLQSNSVEVNTKIDQFSEHIKKLDLIPELQAQLSATQELVAGVRDLVERMTSTIVQPKPRRRTRKTAATVSA